MSATCAVVTVRAGNCLEVTHIYVCVLCGRAKRSGHFSALGPQMKEKKSPEVGPVPCLGWPAGSRRAERRSLSLALPLGMQRNLSPRETSSSVSQMIRLTGL